MWGSYPEELLPAFEMSALYIWRWVGLHPLGWLFLFCKVLTSYVSVLVSDWCHWDAHLGELHAKELSILNSSDSSCSLLMQLVTGSHFLMLLHPCFHQDEKTEVRKMTVAKNCNSHNPPSPVVYPSTSCHSTAFSCWSIWGLPAVVVERCQHLLAKVFLK